jgi:hypothetical protein
MYISCSNSLRRASTILEPIVKRSHEAIRQWVQRLAPICDAFDLDRKLVVSSIFVDETMISVKGKQAWLWIAFEPGLRVFLAFRIGYHPQSIPRCLPVPEGAGGRDTVGSRYGRMEAFGIRRLAGGPDSSTTCTDKS